MCAIATLSVRRAVTPGSGVTFAGTDIAAMRNGVVARGTADKPRNRRAGRHREDPCRGVTASRAWGFSRPATKSWRPGEPLPLGCVYDSNAQILADAVRELGAVPVPLGIVRRRCGETPRRSSPPRLRGMRCAAAVRRNQQGGGGHLVSHRSRTHATGYRRTRRGVETGQDRSAWRRTTANRWRCCPAFPLRRSSPSTSSWRRSFAAWAGRGRRAARDVAARMAVRVNSEIGRTEYLLVSLVHRAATSDDSVSLSAYPLGKGSGSVTTFSRADGFVTIARHQEIVSEGSAGVGAAAVPRAAGGGPGRDRQPLRGTRLSARPTADPPSAHQVPGRRVDWADWRPRAAVSAIWPACICWIPKTGQYNEPFLYARPGTDSWLPAACRGLSSGRATRDLKGSRSKRRSRVRRRTHSA